MVPPCGGTTKHIDNYTLKMRTKQGVTAEFCEDQKLITSDQKTSSEVVISFINGVGS
jgi:hypothetical protein